APVLLRQADALAVLGSFVFQVVGALTIAFHTGNPVQRPPRQVCLPVKVETATEHIAVVAFLALGPGAGDRAGKPASEILACVVEQTEQLEVVAQAVVGIQAQTAVVLLGAVVLYLG